MTAPSTYHFSRLAADSQAKEAGRLRARLAHQRPMIAPLLQALTLTSRGAVILDVGAGSGELTPVLTEAFPEARVLSLDSDEIIRTHFTACAHRVLGDGSALPLGSHTVDLVCLRFVLQHTEQRGAILAEAHRVLRPGGLIWVCESDFTDLYFHPRRRALERFVRAWAEDMRARGGEPSLGHQVPALLSAAGFEVIRAEATLEGTRADEYQWSAGALAILQSAANRSAGSISDSQRKRVQRDLQAMRTGGWCYFGIWQTVGQSRGTA